MKPCTWEAPTEPANNNIAAALSIVEQEIVIDTANRPLKTEGTRLLKGNCDHLKKKRQSDKVSDQQRGRYWESTRKCGF